VYRRGRFIDGPITDWNEELRSEVAYWWSRPMAEDYGWH